MPVLCRVSQSLVLERWLYQSLYFIYSAWLWVFTMISFFFDAYESSPDTMCTLLHYKGQYFTIIQKSRIWHRTVFPHGLFEKKCIFTGSFFGYDEMFGNKQGSIQLLVSGTGKESPFLKAQHCTQGTPCVFSDVCLLLDKLHLDNKNRWICMVKKGSISDFRVFLSSIDNAKKRILTNEEGGQSGGSFKIKWTFFFVLKRAPWRIDIQYTMRIAYPAFVWFCVDRVGDLPGVCVACVGGIPGVCVGKCGHARRITFTHKHAWMWSISRHLILSKTYIGYLVLKPKP